MVNSTAASAAVSAAIAISLVLGACGGPAPVAGKSLVPLPTFSEDAGSLREYHPRVASIAHSLMPVPKDTMGPFLARTHGGYITVHAQVKPGRGRALLGTVVDGGGHAVGKPKYVVDIDDDLTMLVASGKPSRPGALAAYATVLDRGEAVTIVSITDRAEAARSPVQLARTDNHIQSLQLLPTNSGTVCVWAEQPSDGELEALAVFIDDAGKPRGVPVKIASQALAFHAIPLADGMGLAVVRDDDAKIGSTVEWTALAPDLLPRGATKIVARVSAHVTDLDLVHEDHEPNLFHVAWTALSAGEPAVFVATFADTPSSPVTTAVLPSPSHLIQLVAGGAGSAVAWEDSRRPGASGRIELAPIEREGAVNHGKQTELTVAEGARVELRGTASGLAIVTAAETCTTSGACTTSPVFLRLDADLHATQVERLSLGDESSIHASHGWGLLCGDRDCIALTSGGDDPIFVSASDLSVRSTVLSAPLRSAATTVGPHMGTMHAVFEGGHYSDVVATDLGATALVAAMDDLAPPTRARGKGTAKRTDLTAQVVVRAVDPTGKPTAPLSVVTTRSMLNGGIALAAAADPEHGAVIAWFARDNKEPTIHLTRLDKLGVRHNEVLLAPARSEAPSVALAAYGDGWLVAWTDNRTNNVEVYVARVNGSLDRVSHIEQLSRGGRDVSDLSIGVASDRALVAWSDSRDNPGFALADIYVAPIHPADATRAGNDVRVLGTAAHSRSPQVVAFPTGFAAAWIEDAPSAIAAADSLSQGVMLGRLDFTGKPVAAPERLGLAGEGAPSTFAVTALGAELRLVVARSQPERESLDIVDEPFQPNGRAATSVLIPFGGDSALTRGLALSSKVCGFVYAGRDGHGESVQIGSISSAATISSSSSP